MNKLREYFLYVSSAGLIVTGVWNGGWSGAVGLGALVLAALYVAHKDRLDWTKDRALKEAHVLRAATEERLKTLEAKVQDLNLGRAFRG